MDSLAITKYMIGIDETFMKHGGEVLEVVEEVVMEAAAVEDLLVGKVE